MPVPAPAPTRFRVEEEEGGYARVGETMSSPVVPSFFPNSGGLEGRDLGRQACQAVETAARQLMALTTAKAAEPGTGRCAVPGGRSLWLELAVAGGGVRRRRSSRTH